MAGAMTKKPTTDREWAEVLAAELHELYRWADGFVNKRTGIGAGIHAEMWPNLPPSAAKELLRRVSPLIRDFREWKQSRPESSNGAARGHAALERHPQAHGGNAGENPASGHQPITDSNLRRDG